VTKRRDYCGAPTLQSVEGEFRFARCVAGSRPCQYPERIIPHGLSSDYGACPKLSRRRNPKAPEECWHVYWGDIRAGTIEIRSGIPYDEDPWGRVRKRLCHKRPYTLHRTALLWSNRSEVWGRTSLT
jgi:hypothetical protein